MNILRVFLALISVMTMAACKSSSDSSSTPTTTLPTPDVTLDLPSVMKYYFAGSALTTTTATYVPTGINFNEIDRNVKVTKVISITNSVLYDNYATDIHIDELAPKIFTIDSNTCGILKAGSTCQVTISANYSADLFTSIKTARLVLGKADGTIDAYTELYGNILNTSINASQFESNYTVSMDKSFDNGYQQYNIQERVLTVKNNSTSKYLRNDYLVPTLLGANATNYFFSSNLCMYPVPPQGTCDIHVIYKNWKTVASAPDAEVKFPNQVSNYDIKYGQFSVYVPVYSDFGTCSTALVCQGVGTQTRTITSCIKNGVDSVDPSLCTGQLSQTCVSPAGNQTIEVSGGFLTQSCAAGDLNKWVNQSINCSVTDYHASGFTCLKDIFIPTYSDYSPSTNPNTSVCQGTTTGTRTITSCTRSYNSESVPTSKCTDPTPTVTYQSPVGSRTISIDNGVQSQVCLAGSSTWSVTSVTCSSTDYYVNASNLCQAIVYVPTLSAYSTNPVTAVCSGEADVTRTITACVDSHSGLGVSTTKCVDAAATKHVVSPAGYQLLNLYDSNTGNQMGSQKQLCNAGSTTWTVTNVSCYAYYNQSGNTCAAADLTAPSVTNTSDVYKNSSNYSFNITADSNTTGVNVYSDVTCSTQIATGTSNGTLSFSTIASFPENVLTKVYAQGVNPTTLKKSVCTPLFNYMYDTSPPTATFAVNNGATSTAGTSVTLDFANVTENSGLVNKLTVWENNSCSLTAAQSVAYQNHFVYTPTSTGQQLNLSVKLTDAAGNDSSCLTASIFFGLKVLPVYANATNWNSYVNISNSSLANSQMPVCLSTDTQTNNLPSCVHGGDKRYVVTQYTFCTGLTMTDDVGMFDWNCKVNATSGLAEFYSALKKDNLTQSNIGSMIDATGTAPVWKTVRVNLFVNGNLATRSDGTGFYSNNLGYLVPDAVNPVSLTSSALIYVVQKPNPTTSTPESVNTAGINLNGNGVAVVVMPNTTLNLSLDFSSQNCTATGGAGTSNTCVIYSSGKSFIYFEGAVSGIQKYISRGILFGGTNYGGIKATTTGFDVGIYLTGFNDGFIDKSVASGAFSTAVSVNSSSYNRIQNVSVSGSQVGLSVSQSNYNTLSRINSQNNKGDGVDLNASSNNLMFDSTISNNASYGVVITNGLSGNSLVSSVIASNGNQGLRVLSSQSQVFTDLTIANNNGYGMLISAGDGNFIHNVLSLNNKYSGLALGTSSQNTISQLALLQTQNTDGYGNLQLNASYNNKFTGVFYFETQVASLCQINNSTNPGVTSSCVPSGYSDFFTAYSFSTATNYPDSFVNPQPTAGLYASTNLLGPLVTLGISNVSMDSTTIGNAPSNAVGFDWTLNKYDYYLRSNSAGGNSVNTVDSVATAETVCPTETDGDQYLDNNTCYVSNVVNTSIHTLTACSSAGGSWKSIFGSSVNGIRFLKNAKEIVDPSSPYYSSVGNHNGLCEAGETCLYAPNFGAYQGSGTLNHCIYNPKGYMTGTVMYGHPTNGK